MFDLSPDKNFLTVSELAEMWRCSRVHIYALIKRGALPATNIGERRIVSREAAQDFIKRNTINAAVKAA